MDISSFSRMRSYRKDGRTVILLKLLLPRLRDGEGSEFNSFYLALAERYLDIAGRISEDAPAGIAPTVISVVFELPEQIPDAKSYEKTKENLIVVKRVHRIRKGASSTVSTAFDYYDSRRDIFLK